MRRLPATILLLVAACGGSPNKPIEPKTAEHDAGEGTAGERQSASLVHEGEAVAKDDAPDAETADQIYARVQADIVGCYEQGKKSTPKMLSGRATLDVSIDSSGKAACVVVSDDTGLTQEVEDCMSARMTREAFKSNGSTWSTEIPVVVKDGKVSLGPQATGAPAPRPSRRTASRTPRTRSSRRCSLSSTSARRAATASRTCAAGVLAGAKFPPPKGAVGLVSVPVKVLARSQ